MSMHSEEDGPTLASAMRQAAYSTYWAAVSAIIGSQASEMGCVHPGRASDGEEYSDAASDEWDRGFADDPAARHQGANGAAAHRDANGAVGAPGDGAHLVAGAGSRPGSADSAHLLSSAAADSPGAAAARAAAEAAEVGPQVDPEPLVAGDYLPSTSEPSSLLEDAHLCALAAAVPLRHRWRRWRLVYATARDGISLSTLYRRAGEQRGPCVLVVRERGGAVFGCFTAEAWRVAPRYYGTGESFVFQLQPRAALWRWHQKRMRVVRNDFFQFGRPECVALGGAPAYALCLDSDLAFGSSGPSETFGSPCLASSEEFGIGRVELWSLA